jgi:hypothetical protein
MQLKLRLLTLSVVIVFLTTAPPTTAGTYFQSNESSYADGAALPNPPYHPHTSGNASQTTGHKRNTPSGSVLEWRTTQANITDMFNEVAYQVRPPAYGTLTLDAVVQINRVDGVQVWPNSNGSSEGFDKAMELVGTSYRWTLNFGIRSQNGPPGTWNIFVTNPNPGHFNPQCEVYDSYWQNGAYGRGLFEANACQPDLGKSYYAMLYDVPYRVQFTVNFASTNTGSITLWVNGTKVLEYLNIKTCNSPCTHDHFQLWGTYHQPGYKGPAHTRYLSNLQISDDAVTPSSVPTRTP